MLKCFITLCIFLLFYYSEASSSLSERTLGKIDCPISEESCEEKFELSNGGKLTNKYRGNNKLRKVGRYNQLILVQESPIPTYYQHQHIWPNTSFTSDNCGLTVGACKSLLKPKRWVLHGLWPFKFSGQSPTFCTENLPEYSDSLMNATFLMRLDKKWPNFITHRQGGSIWDFEWNKHGSCASDQKSMDTVPKYFEKALEYLNDYNFGDMLTKCDIVPGGSYRLKQIMTCIKFNVKKRFRIICFIDQYSETKEQYLYEARICFKKETLLLDNCKREDFISCDDTKDIIYGTLKKA